MTDSDTRQEVWKVIPGVQWWYQASDRGRIRSLDHKDRNGREHAGTVLNPRPDPDGYLVVNITLEDGTRKHGMSVARLVLLAHAGEPADPGLQACHGPGGQKDNRWPENLRWDTDEANRDDRWEHHPPKPKPLKVCVRCGDRFSTPGRRCHSCVVEISIDGARLMAGGKDPEEAAKELDYPSPVGLFRLARKYGGLRCVVEPVLLLDEVNAAVRELGRGEGKSAAAVTALREHRSWLQRVTGRRAQRGDAQ